jgi:hypothetical protein
MFALRKRSLLSIRMPLKLARPLISIRHQSSTNESKSSETSSLPSSSSSSEEIEIYRRPQSFTVRAMLAVFGINFMVRICVFLDP